MILTSSSGLCTQPCVATRLSKPSLRLSGRNALLPNSVIAVDLLKVVQERGVEQMAAERRAVANHDKLPPSTGERHVHAAGVSKKPNFAFAIGPNQRNNDCF